MGRIEKIKRELIEEANRRVLNEQEISRKEKMSVVAEALNYYKLKRNMGNLGERLKEELELSLIHI